MVKLIPAKKYIYFSSNVLIYLLKSIKTYIISENIQVVALPSHSDEDNKFGGSEATVSGWGLDKDGKNISYNIDDIN